MDKNDESLFSKGSLILFSVIIIIGLFLLFPGKKLLQDFDKKQIDLTSVEYLKLLVNQTPDDVALRLRLVHELMMMGHLNDASLALAPLVNQKNLNNETQLLRIDILFQQYFAETESIQRQQKKLILIQVVSDVYPKLEDSEKLDTLAQQSYQLGEPLLAAKIYQHLVALLGSHSFNHAHTQQALVWLLIGIKSSHAEDLTKDALYYAIKELEALLSANQTQAALQRAKIYIPQFKHSEVMLNLGIKIAGYAKDNTQSRDWGRLSLHQFPKGDEQFKQQINREIAANDATNSVQWIKKQIEKTPNSELRINLGIKIAGYANDAIQSRDWGRLSLQRFAKNNEKITQQIAREKSANDPKSSLRWVQAFIQKNPSKENQLLVFEIELARSAGDKNLVRQLGLKALKKKPNDPALIAQQIQNELAVQNLAAAFEYGQQQVALIPNNIEARKQLANFALWTSHQEVTLKQWSWLYQKTGDEKFIKDAIKMGGLLFKYDEVVSYYGYLWAKRALTPEEMEDYYKVLQGTGFLDAGVTQLKAYVKKWSKQQQAWLYLAQTQNLIGRYPDAIETLNTAEDTLGQSFNIFWKKIELNLKLTRFEEAWHLLFENADGKNIKKEDFWTLYAQMSWILGRDAEAERGYSYLLTHTDVGKESFDRLLELKRLNTGNEEDQIKLFLRGWDKFKQPQYLYAAIDLAVKLKKTKQINELMVIAEQETHLFDSDVNLWLIKANIAAKAKQPLESKKFLLQALAIDKESTEARILILWHMIEHDSNKELNEFLNESIALSGDQPVLWEVIATAYRRLTHPHKAIEWYARAVKFKPKGYVLLLSYAETLIEAGKPQQANRIRHYVMSELRPQMVAHLPKTDPRAFEELKRRYGEALRGQLGMEISETWFKFEQSTHLKQAMFDEYRITWLLAQGRMIPARRYIFKKMQQRLKLPAWQKMALAIYDNDVNAVEKILISTKKLLPTDRVVGLGVAGRDQEALITAREHLNRHQQVNELTFLRRQAANLGVNNPNGFALRAKSENLSELDMIGVKATAAVTRVENTFWFDYEALNLSSSQNLIVKSSQKQEHNLAFKWRYRDLHTHYWLQTQAHLRDDHNVFGLEGEIRRYIWEGWSIHLNGGYNQYSDESAGFRLLGVKDHIKLGFEGQVTKRDYFSATVQGNRYKTRSGDSLGTGFQLGFQLGHRIKFEHPSINVNLHGTVSQTNLADSLPLEIKENLGKDRDINGMLSEQYKELGLNLTVYDGEIRPFGFVEQRFHYYFDLGLFVSDPFSGLGVATEAGIGMRLFNHDDLSLIGRYVDSQGGVDSIATKALELRYSIRFD